MVICPGCKAEQINGTLFCSECGSDIPLVSEFSSEQENEIQEDTGPVNISLLLEKDGASGGYRPQTQGPVNPESDKNPNSGPGPGKPREEKLSDQLFAPEIKARKPPLPKPPGIGKYAPVPGKFVAPPPPPRPNSKTKSSIREDLRLIVLNTGRILECPKKETIVIGRADAITGESPDIDLGPDDGANLGVSRRHVSLIFKNNQPFILDLGSKNNSFINRRHLFPGKAYPIGDGDEVRLGNIILKILYDPDGLI